MAYLLYKQAEEDKEKKDGGNVIDRKRLASIVSGLGGGILGYLGTRYLLGLKGFMPGALGAGAGAAAGVIGSKLVQDIGGSEADERDRSFAEAVKKSKELAGEHWTESAAKGYGDAAKTVAVPALGAGLGARGGHAIGERITRIAVEDQAATLRRAMVEARDAAAAAGLRLTPAELANDALLRLNSRTLTGARRTPNIQAVRRLRDIAATEGAGAVEGMHEALTHIIDNPAMHRRGVGGFMLRRALPVIGGLSVGGLLAPASGSVYRMAKKPGARQFLDEAGIEY